ncbi:MAG: glutamate racemase [Nitrospira bacterium HGW-Nitrospira-1]|nr:MAG: glutamate racemase [Nitrospira bacterium HGW-Nitrospira-1]
MNKRSKPIGVFDSGIGGLTALKEIFRKLPHESTVYLGDTARVPYGIRSPETVTRYSFENTRFLFSKEVKMIVIACNTASSVSLEAIKNSVPVPVIGVIEPGAKAAAAATKNKKIGIIGTEATIKSNSYAKAITSIDNRIEVFGIACPLFVPLVEEGWTEGKIVEMVAQEYLKEMKHKGIDALVLGCTHYPLLKGVLSAVMGESVSLIDSAIETAKEIETILKNLSLLNTSGDNISREFYVTDSPEKFKTVGERFLGEHIQHIKKIKLEMEV